VGGARQPPFTKFTITKKVAVFAPAEWEDTLTLFHLYPYVLCGLDGVRTKSNTCSKQDDSGIPDVFPTCLFAYSSARVDQRLVPY
jgi:hypothetical protein